MIVAETNVPIIPCHLQGCFKTLGPGQKWPRRRRIYLTTGDPINFESAPNNREGWKQVAAISQEHVARLAQATSAAG